MNLLWERGRCTTATIVKFIRHSFQSIDDFFSRWKHLLVMACVTGGRIHQYAIRIGYNEPPGFHEETLKIAYAIVSVVTLAGGGGLHERSNSFQIVACFLTRGFVNLVFDHPICQLIDAFISRENTAPERFDLPIFGLNPFFQKPITVNILTASGTAFQPEKLNISFAFGLI